MKTPVYAIIDLTSRTSARYEISESLYRNYIGGKMLGARLLYDLTQAGIDPLGPDSVVIINTSPANGTGAPCSSRFNMTFKNVLTGGIAYNEPVVEYIRERCSFIAPIAVYPGENELEALVTNALVVLRGVITPKVYK